MVYARRPARRPKARLSGAKKWPAPVAGWVSNRALSEPGSIEGPGAAVLDNFTPRSTGVSLRRGKSRYATLEDQTKDVSALFTYNSGSIERLFGANDNAIYNLTNVPVASSFQIGGNGDDIIGDGGTNTFGVASTDGLAVASGFTGGDWSVVQFATTGGIFLVGVNGVDEGFLFDGTRFYPLNADGTFELAYDAKAGDFAAGETLTGGTSAATATIYSVEDNGDGTGTLFLTDVSGTFQDNEALTDSDTGDATANGAAAQAAPGIDFGDLTSADMSFVWSYKNRLYFCQTASLSIWYLEADSIGGAASEFPLGGVFANGGSVLFGARWSLESGGEGGLSDQNVIVTTEGEVAIYQGNDPNEAATWSLVGVYRIGTPLGKRAYIRGGGDLAIATTIGLVPLSRAISLDAAALGVASVSYRITDAWSDSIRLRGGENWQAIVWPEEEIAIIALPDMAGMSAPVMFVSNTQTGAWGRYTGWQGESFTVFQGRLYFGSTNGKVFQANVGGLDDGLPYTGAVVPLFEDMGFSAGVKIAKVAKARVRASTNVEGRLDALADFNLTLPTAPDAPNVEASNQWGSAVWGVSRWDAAEPSVINQAWRSVGAIGYSLSPCYQVTSGAAAPLDVDLIDLELLFTVAEAVT